VSNYELLSRLAGMLRAEIAAIALLVAVGVSFRPMPLAGALVMALVPMLASGPLLLRSRRHLRVLLAGHAAVVTAVGAIAAFFVAIPPGAPPRGVPVFRFEYILLALYLLGSMLLRVMDASDSALLVDDLR
jgi:hypothetical protein